jgi:tetratricopeptide (TPR) repeat protein
MQRATGRAVSRETNYFCFPQELYARACLIDQHSDAFSQWLRWARSNSLVEAENVAHAWSKALPDAVEPLLFLMEEAEKRNAFPTALSYLNKAERIDAVNPTVRAARLRLLAVAAMQHLQKKKPHLAAQKLAEIGALPESRQGDRPAFLDALRVLICLASGDKPGSSQALLEVERVLGDGLAALLLIFGCATSAKRKDLVMLPSPDTLPERQRSHLPASMARLIALAADVGLTRNFQLPIEYFDETESQFPRSSGSLNVEQIRLLGELGIAGKHPGLAWAASAAGLDRGGPTEAYFLLLRARALPVGQDDRYAALTAAAAELGRSHRDMEVVDRAVEASRDSSQDDPLSLTADQAREVLRKEKASPAFPSSSSLGPDYSDLFPDDLCMCPACRGKRGESSDPDLDDIFNLDEDELKRTFFEAAPKDIPREILPALFEVAKGAFLSGEDPAKVLSQILLEDAPGRKKKNGRRG